MIVSRDTKIDYLWLVYEVFNLWSILAKREIKFCGGESEDGQKFLPPNPLTFCPPDYPAKRGDEDKSSSLPSSRSAGLGG